MVFKGGQEWSRVVKGCQGEGDNSFPSRVLENTTNHTGEFPVHSLTSDLFSQNLLSVCSAAVQPRSFPAPRCGQRIDSSTKSARLLPNYKFLTWTVCNGMAVESRGCLIVWLSCGWFCVLQICRYLLPPACSPVCHFLMMKVPEYLFYNWSLALTTFKKSTCNTTAKAHGYTKDRFTKYL
jgi:hypothetical protein